MPRNKILLSFLLSCLSASPLQCMHISNLLFQAKSYMAGRQQAKSYIAGKQQGKSAENDQQQSHVSEQQQFELEAVLETYQTELIFEKDKKPKVDYKKSNLEDLYKVNRLFQCYRGTYKGKRPEGLKQYLKDAFYLESYQSHEKGSFKRVFDVLDCSIRDLFEHEHFLSEEIKNRNWLYDVIRERSFSDSLVNILLERGANPNAVDEDGFAPLHVIAREWKRSRLDKKYDDEIPTYATTCDIIKKLIAVGARVDMKDRRRKTPFHYAIENEHLDLFKLLMEGLSKDRVFEVLEILCSNLSNYERKISKDCYFGDDNDYKNNKKLYKMFKIILKTGALNINKEPERRMLSEMIRYFIFDRHVKAAQWGCTWISHATPEKKKKLLNLLQQYVGLSRITLGPDYTDGDGRPKEDPYHPSKLRFLSFARLGGTHVIRGDNHFCKVTREEDLSEYLSHFCIKCKLLDCFSLKCFKKKGVACGHYCVVPLLSEYNPKELLNEGGEVIGDGTLLMHAIIEGAEDVVEWLLEHGVEINTSDFNGNTPLSLAVKFERKKIVEALLKQGAFITDKVLNEFAQFPEYYSISFLLGLIPPCGWDVADENNSDKKISKIASLKNLCSKALIANPKLNPILLGQGQDERADERLMKLAKDSSLKELLAQLSGSPEKEKNKQEIVSYVLARQWMYFKRLVHGLAEHASDSIKIYTASVLCSPKYFIVNLFDSTALINKLNEICTVASFEDLEDGIKRELTNVVGVRLGQNN